jgi:hypothetical protein
MILPLLSLGQRGSSAALPVAHIPELSPRTFGVVHPMLDCLGQPFRANARDVFAVDLIAPLKQPVDLMEAAAARIHANDRSLPLRLIQAECSLAVLDHRANRLSQMEITWVEPVDDHLFVLRGYSATHLAPIADFH